MLILTKLLTVSAITIAAQLSGLPTKDLERYYWDCDTMFMKQELSGADLPSCLAVTDELQSRLFKNDYQRFKQYWEQNRLREWQRRGYTAKRVM